MPKDQISPLPTATTQSPKPSSAIPPSLAPFVKLTLIGLIGITVLVAFALFRQRMPSSPNESSVPTPEAAKLTSKLVESFENQEFALKLPEGLVKKTIGNQILLFPHSQAAEAYESCTSSDAAKIDDQCQVVMSISVEAFSPDHDFSLEKTRSDQESTDPLATTFIDAQKRSWIIEPVSTSGLAVVAETKSASALHQATVVANAAAYQETFNTPLVPDRFLNTVKDLLSTIEFNNQK